ncbi:MAG: right-handed parallel beta-helix repeat-containing protein [Acidobacteriia bacterium]|nr:right-handed parallel beta-helix repeat-containing protein [Terriglobia bacterium]
MTTRLLALIALSALLALAGFTWAGGGPREQPSATAKASFYVSPEGNDSWSGRLEKPNPAHSDGPFRSVARARDAVRQLKGHGTGPLTVVMRGGVYELSETLVFGPQDSGSSDAPVVYAAYPGEVPVLSGGRPITGWKQGQGGLWSAPVPDAKDGKGYFRELFVNGQRRVRARTPNVGSYFNVDGQISRDEDASFRFHGSEVRPEHAQQGDVEVVGLNKWQAYRLTVRAVDEGSHNVTLASKVWPSYEEENSRYWIENSLDALDAPGEWYLSRRDGVVYYRPLAGEDPNRVEVIAPALEQLVRFAGEPGREVHDITLSGLTFAYADWSLPPEGLAQRQATTDVGATIDAQGARACTIERCVLTHMGLYAVGFGRGSKNNRIVGNEMMDLGGGGVKIGDADSSVHPMRAGGGGGGGQGGQGGGRRQPNFGGQPPFGRRRPGGFPGGGQRGGQQGGGAPAGEPQYPPDPADYRSEENYPHSESETTSDNIVSDNHIHDIGSVFQGAVGIWVGQSYGNTLSHNEIHDTYYSGISCGWTWGFGHTAAHDNIIEFNHIYKIGRGVLSDMGGIYTLGTQPGTVLRNNVIHDVHHDEGREGYGGWGIYLDSATSEVRVENNVVYNNDEGMVNNQGEENTITNNIFAFGRNTQFQRNRAAYKPSFTYDHNIVYYREGVLMRIRPDQGQFTMDYNDYYRAGGHVEIFIQRSGTQSFREWQANGQDPHSIEADPRFVDPERGNFTLRPDSPALRVGFKPIDVSQVGPRH